MVRLCIPWGGTMKFTNTSRGLKFEGSAMMVDKAKTLLRYVRPSQMEVVRSSSICLKRLKSNLSDVIMQGFFPREGSYYYVPEVTHAKAPGFLSGYEVNEYVKNQTSKEYSKYGLLENYKAFDGEIYGAIIVLFLTIIVTKWFFNWLLRRKMNHFIYGKLQKKLNSRMKKGMHLKMLNFVAGLSFFLISNAFFSLYSTSQVVTDKPFVITDYRSLINSNLSIYLLMSANVDQYFEPSDANIRNNDLTNKFFNYFSKKRLGRYSYHASDWKDDNFFKSIFRFNKFAKNLVDKKYVFMSHLSGVLHLRSRLCASSGPNEYFRIFAFKDAEQREILVGNAFRSGYYDGEVKKKLKLFELFNPASSQMESIRVMNYYLDMNPVMSRERRSQQILYCLDEKLEAYQKDETFASDVQFFKAFAAALTCMTLLAFGVLLFEILKNYCPKVNRKDPSCKIRAKKQQRTKFPLQKLGITRGPSKKN